MHKFFLLITILTTNFLNAVSIETAKNELLNHVELLVRHNNAEELEKLCNEDLLTDEEIRFTSNNEALAKIAIEWRASKVLELLFKKQIFGVNETFSDDNQTYRLLQIAIGEEDSEMVKFLIKHGAAIDANDINLASNMNLEEIVQILKNPDAYRQTSRRSRSLFN